MFRLNLDAPRIAAERVTFEPIGAEPQPIADQLEFRPLASAAAAAASIGAPLEFRPLTAASAAPLVEFRPIGAPIDAARPAGLHPAITFEPLPAQPVGALFAARVDRVPTLTPAQQLEKDAADTARAALAGRLVAMRLLPTDGAGQVDVADAARVVLMLHLPNAAMQRELYRSHIDVPTQLDALLLARPELRAWGTLDSTEGMLEPQFWGAWADFVRLEQWNLNADELRIVLKADFASLAPRQTRVTPNTGDFALFIVELEELLLRQHYQTVRGAASHLIRRNALLLYVVRCCLLHKNGPGVLQLARFDWLGKCGRELVWQWMLARKDAHLERVRADDRDFYERVLPVQLSLDSLLRMATFDLPARQAVCAPAVCAVQPSPLAVAPVPAPQSPAVVQPAAPAPPSRDDEPEEEEEPPLPPAREEPTEEEAAELVAEAEAEEEPAAAAEEPAAVQRRIGTAAAAHLCAYHDRVTTRADGFCARACVARRLGAHIAPAAHPHVASSIVVRAAGEGAERAQQVAASVVVTALTPGRPRARDALLRANRLPSVPGTGVRSASEWVDMTRAVEHVGADAQLPDDVDAMASACGWRAAPANERLARYVTAYGPGEWRDGAWRLRGWTPADSAVAKWTAARPTVPLRTLQAIAYVMQ